MPSRSDVHLLLYTYLPNDRTVRSLVRTILGVSPKRGVEQSIEVRDIGKAGLQSNPAILGPLLSDHHAL
jgi:hypothetical protein